MNKGDSFVTERHSAKRDGIVWRLANGKFETQCWDESGERARIIHQNVDNARKAADRWVERGVGLLVCEAREVLR